MNIQEREARLRERLAIARHCLNIVVDALVAVEEFKEPQRHQRRWWVKSWIDSETSNTDNTRPFYRNCV